MGQHLLGIRLANLIYWVAVECGFVLLKNKIIGLILKNLKNLFFGALIGCICYFKYVLVSTKEVE
jgi:tetrahydromethanopterin S-methyltransferase subunit C